MASFNSALFLTLLVAIAAFMAAPSSVEAQLTGILRIANISGIVLCSTNGTSPPANGTVPTNGTVSANSTVTNPLPFANATVKLVCGTTTVATTTTDPSGIINFLISGIQNLFVLLSSLLSGGTNCKVVVTTPLAQCNATLPAVGGLVGNLTQLPSTTGAGGLLNLGVTNFLFMGLRPLPILQLPK